MRLGLTRIAHDQVALRVMFLKHCLGPITLFKYTFSNILIYFMSFIMLVLIAKSLKFQKDFLSKSKGTKSSISMTSGGLESVEAISGGNWHMVHYKEQ